MAVPSHRSTMSVANNNLAPPSADGRPRRMTSPSLPPPSPLNLPEPVYPHRRPPSPLRNGVTADPDTGELSEDGSDVASMESQERASITQFAAKFAQRMGSFVSGNNTRSPNYLPTDEELEAEAEMERERTRREAERILSREAAEAERKRLEERVMAMLEKDMTQPLPPPSLPSSSQPPSPASSNKDSGSWLNVVRNRLTPTKEPLTPAQQIIQETKTREKEIEKEEKQLAKEKKELEREMKKSARKAVKQKSGEWPSASERKFDDPAFLKLGIPSLPADPPQLSYRTMSSSPSSSIPIPIRPGDPITPPRFTASPMRSNDAGTSSPARSGPPLYAQFNDQGALDIPGTLLTIAGRFEKLEKWTVSHVRALEERMDDVERWLVEKEKDKESSAQGQANGVQSHRTGEPATLEAAVSELRDELAEVQGRIGELGREMAKMVTSPANLSSGPSRNSASITRVPSTSSSVAVRSISSQVSTSPQSTPPKTKDAKTSPITTPQQSAASSRTRLPYPTGDYATPPDSVFLQQGPFSPPNSPPQPESTVRAVRQRSVSISGLPAQSFDLPSVGSSPSGLPSSRPQSPPSLPRPPSTANLRQASVSPTPRKRYTVALGQPVTSANAVSYPSDADSDREHERPRSRSHSRQRSRDFGRQFLSSSPASASMDTTDDSDGGGEETIGRAAARSSGLQIPKFKEKPRDGNDTSPSPSPQPKRVRPQSMYSGPLGATSTQSLAAPKPITPLNTRLRSRSTDRLGLGFDSGALSDSSSASGLPPVTPVSGKFVDPLVRRRQTKEAIASAAPPPPKIGPGKPKVPVGQLVAFFNQG